MTRIKIDKNTQDTNKLINSKFTALNIKLDLFKDEIDERFEDKLKVYRNEVVGFKDEVVGELQKLRDEVSVTGHHYEKTNKRVDKIDKHLGINTSVVF